MPLNNPSSLYTGGKAVLNPMPFVNLALQARAKKEARTQAIDNYYSKLPSTINDKGIRDQEIPIINKKRDELYAYAMKNRSALRNPNIDGGAARMAMDKLIREAQSIATESQNAAKDDLHLKQVWSNPNNQWALNNDEFVVQNQQHNLPVTDPNYRRVDINGIMANKPFDIGAYAQSIKKQFPDDIEVSRVPDKDNPGYDIVTTAPKLSKEGIEKIYATVADKVHSEPRYLRSIQKAMQADPSLTQKIDQIAQKHFGHPVKTEEDLAAAYTISLLPSAPTKEKSVTNWNDQFQAKNKEFDRREKLKDRYLKGRLAYRKSLGLDTAPQDEEGVVFDETGGDTEVMAEEYIPSSKGEPGAFASSKPGAKIYKGVVFGSDGQVLKEGEVIIDRANIPGNLKLIADNNKIEFGKSVSLRVKDGNIEAVKLKNGNWINRDAIKNYQKIADKEPLKGKHLQFGSGNNNSSKKKKIAGW